LEQDEYVVPNHELALKPTTRIYTPPPNGDKNQKKIYPQEMNEGVGQNTTKINTWLPHPS
jgi:hypothetical protein